MTTQLIDCIGNTPLIRLNRLSDETGCEILGKAEFMNPGGSVKDRAALGMVRAARRSGELQPGGVIVEGTAGNTGIGLALVGNALGHRTVIVMPDNQSLSKITALRAFGERMGISGIDQNLCAEDSGVTAITVKPTDTDHVYIPYTNRPLGWHTDGYYNSMDKQIRSLLLHCVTPAASGGANALLDHEMAYIRLRQANPEYVRVLMEPDVMTIPANIDKDGTVIRPDRHGPVFTIRSDGQLHMRYTARKRNIIWKQNAYVQQAVKLLEDFMNSDSPYIYRGTLQSGQGLICNNVLHDRSAFEDDGNHHRLLYRLRYYDRMIQT